MGMTCYIVRLVMLSTLIIHTVQGFGLNDVIRELEVRDLKPATWEIQAPVDVIVSVALEVLDANSDGQVALSEIHNLIANYFEATGQREYGERGIIMTVAKIIDADDNGFIDPSEYRRAASVFVTEVDEGSVGRLVGMALKVYIAAEDLDTVLQSYIPLVIRVLDQNKDGEISQQEIEPISNSHIFYPSGYEIVNRATNADRNGDGNLDEAEARQWFEEVKTIYTFRNLMAYAKVASLGGMELAETWVERW